MSERDRRSRAARITSLFLLCGLIAAGNAEAAVCTVDVAATGADNGASWANAYTDLQSALRNSACTEIWVARGLYKPGTTQSDSFLVPADVAVYGGFAGGETFRDQRNPASHVTVLSGDVDANDVTDANGVLMVVNDRRGTNAYRVVRMDGTVTPVTAATILDGFTITAGYAQLTPNHWGGGLYCNGQGNGSRCDPTLANLTFSGNEANLGGGVFNDGSSSGASSPTLTNVVFSGNKATQGGALYNYGKSSGEANPTLEDVAFTSNTAGWGGAVVNDGTYGGTSSPTFVDVAFRDNEGFAAGAVLDFAINSGRSSPTFTNATFAGNHAILGGALLNDARYQGTSSPALTNVTFSGNSADQVGGAIFNDGSWDGSSSPTLVHVILWEDTADLGSPEIYNTYGTAVIISSVVQGSNGSGASWDTTLGADGGGNLDADPVLGPMQDNGGPTPTMALGPGSAAIDAGLSGGGCPPTDQRGVLRPQGSACDIGAFEVDPTPPTVTATSLGPAYVTSGPTAFTVTFSEPVRDSWGDADPDDATNPANYLLVEAGADRSFDTPSCTAGVASEDAPVAVSGVAYDAATRTAAVSLSAPLPLGTYRLFVCGTTSIEDIAGNTLDGGTDFTIDFAVTPAPVVSRRPPRLRLRADAPPPG